MSLFTLAYISRIGGFAFATAIVQGALVAACEIACRRAAANAAIDTRFRLTCAHFAGLLLLPLVSVAILQRSLSSGALESAPLLPPEYLSHGGGDPIRLTFVLLAVWLAGVVVMALILAKDLQKAVQLSGEPAEPALVEAVSRLAADWVHLPTVVQSPSVRAPEVRGFGRAILVTPMGFARMLAEDERDAVLLHELAHVKRSDFGWNVAQRMILALLCFGFIPPLGFSTTIFAVIGRPVVMRWRCDAALLPMSLRVRWCS